MLVNQMIDRILKRAWQELLFEIDSQHEKLTTIIR